MIKAFRWSQFGVLSTVVFLFCFVVGSYAAEPRPQPKIPEPISPLFPTPDVYGVPHRGDVVRGERFYQSWGCPSCHTLDGKGGKLGPDLARTGEIHRDPYWFRRYLSDPRSIIPNSVKPPVKLSEPDMDDLIAYLMSLSRFRQGIR